MATKMLGRTLEACPHGRKCRHCISGVPGRARRQARRTAKRTERTVWKREEF